MRSMKRIAALLIPLALLAGCSDTRPSEGTEWLAATTGERDAAKIQKLLDDVHEATGITPGPEADQAAAEFIKETLGRETAIEPLLKCMIAVAEREGGGEFVDLSTRCHEDFWIAYEE